MENTYEIVISEIEEGSIAEELEIEAGDVLLSVNGKKPKDIFEYYYLINDEYIAMEIKKKDGEVWDLDIEKDPEEKLGLIFAGGLLDEPKRCSNKCVFCFIDQLPKGLRDTLYFKDDDTRLSFMHGNYVTLTNLKEEEINRIIDYRIQPINISVHTTNPDLRTKMLCNKNAANINNLLERFADNAIIMNTQIVLVPDVNDGEELDRTLKDLSELYPAVNTVSVVPVGVTKFRDHLSPLRKFSLEECRETIGIIQDHQRVMLEKHSVHFVYPSDEFFIQGKLELPGAEYYEDFTQLENGVGMVTLFMDEAREALLTNFINVPENEISVITGVSAYEFIEVLCQEVMKKYPQLKIKVHKIINNFFGNDITVSGLITGTDILEQLFADGYSKKIIIPENMLKYNESIFLDDVTLPELTGKLEGEIVPVELNGAKFIERLIYFK